MTETRIHTRFRKKRTPTGNGSRSNGSGSGSGSRTQSPVARTGSIDSWHHPGSPGASLPHRLSESPAPPRASSLDPGSNDDRRSDDQPPNPGDPDEEDHDPALLSELADIRLAQQYIQCLQNATLQNGDFSAEDIDQLMDPPQLPFELDEDKTDDADTILSLRQFMAAQTVESYNAIKEAIELRHPDDKILSYDQVKRLIANITGVRPIVKDMCPNSCMAYTGPLADRDTCLHCGTNRYDSLNKPQQMFDTIPIPFAIQAIMRHSQTAEAMGYLSQRLRALLNQLELGEQLETFDDICCGSDILKATENGDIRENDIVLMLSFDGAQIYRNKASDCWIYIWVFINLAPGIRYKKKYVFPGGVFPGPNKIKDAQTFLFVGLHPIASINRQGGLPIWNAHSKQLYKSKLYIILGTADGPGMVYLNGLVGHSGKIGCRLWCGLVGRKKPGASYYFPLLSKPLNYDVVGCNHSDVPAHNVHGIDNSRYQTSLHQIISSRTKREYELNRRETGICKPSLFSGLSDGTYLGIPNMFPTDIMHLILNLADLLIPLWRGKFECADTDSRDTWTWAVLQGNIWEIHGRDVARCTPYLPGSFDRPPRNPAEKINSGYKAWEYLVYIFGLGPGLFYGVLPPEIWRSYCKLVSGVRIIYQKTISRSQLQTAHKNFIEFIQEFESLYVQRRADRIHMARQSIHGLSHLAPEVARVGPGITYSQWTMERTVGNLTEELKQHSEPYKHLSRRAVQRAEVNALKLMVPTLDRGTKKEESIPRGGENLGDGYILLRARDSCKRPITDAEAAAYQHYLTRNNETIPLEEISVIRWARLRLPNGQVARSLWKECRKPLSSLRMARNIKLNYHGTLEFGEVQYYFQVEFGSGIRALAVVALYSRPNAGLLKESSYTLWTCKKVGHERIIVIDVQQIESVVCMAPHSVEMLGPDWDDWVFLVEKPGLDVALLSGAVELVNDEE
ncbi:hypothetical protein H0H92_002347 [Tricholoma furcatifolium]|nr:hypothetical protein H0H92_002347 [Tricholoma furcatifolium]